MLFVLAFDHRNSLRSQFFGDGGPPTPVLDAQAREAKQVIYEGLLAAIALGMPSGTPAILVDYEYGAEVARQARSAGVTVALAVEKSGQRELTFEDEPFFARGAEIRPDYLKVLVRYNPEADEEMNRRQREKLLTVQEWVDRNRMGFILELLVPPEPCEASDPKALARFDLDRRPALTLKAVARLLDAGLRPAFWKLEGMNETSEYGAIASTIIQVHPDARCLVLGRGADASAVDRWLTLAAPVPGFGGFAVGRTLWWEPMKSYFKGEKDRREAAATIASNYLRLVSVYLSARASA